MMMKGKRLFSMLALLLVVATTGSRAETINLATVTTATTAQDGDVLTGTLGTNVEIGIADGATVTLSDVTIEGHNHSSYEWAGINCVGDAILILKGTNTVRGFDQKYPGIHIATGKTLTIKGDGKLTASSNGYAAGIGGGNYVDCGNIVIEGGTINATGGDSAAGIGGGGSSACGNITITDGVTSVTATRAGTAPYSIGAGDTGTCGTVTIGGTVTGGIEEASYTYVTLTDSKDNSATLASLETLATQDGQRTDITLKRTLSVGGWNTLCLPFSIDTPAGWTVKRLDTSSFADGTLTLNFADAGSSIEAGKPYLVKVTTQVVNPIFSGVTIESSTTPTTTSYADFVPVMNPTSLTGGDKTVLFVTDGNKLTYPSADGNINGFRAYFQLTGGAVAQAVAFVMNIADAPTAIQMVAAESQQTGAVFDLQGRLVGIQPAVKGLYIVNGRKVVIK